MSSLVKNLHHEYCITFFFAQKDANETPTVNLIGFLNTKRIWSRPTHAENYENDEEAQIDTVNTQRAEDPGENQLLLFNLETCRFSTHRVLPDPQHGYPPRRLLS